MLINHLTRANCPQREDHFAWVYVLVAGINANASKVGFAVDLAVRMKRLAEKYADRDYNIRLHCAYRVPYALNGSATHHIEARTHSRLYTSRAIGSMDWFFAPPDDVELALVTEARALLGPSFDLVRFPSLST